jgi:hypothetical protein
MYVLKHKENGKYVARPGSKHSYTRKLEDAQIFATRWEAETASCVESESAVYLETLFSQ